jgi:transcriptional regulator with XRE-family HTH domain
MSFDREGFDKEIAVQIGIQRASYANIEGGRQRVPVDILWRAAVVLGVSISALVPEPLQVPARVGAPTVQEDAGFSTSYNLGNLLVKAAK